MKYRSKDLSLAKRVVLLICCSVRISGHILVLFYYKNRERVHTIGGTIPLTPPSRYEKTLQTEPRKGGKGLPNKRRKPKPHNLRLMLQYICTVF